MTKDVPDSRAVAGVPARRLRDIDAELKQEIDDPAASFVPWRRWSPLTCLKAMRIDRENMDGLRDSLKRETQAVHVFSRTCDLNRRRPGGGVPA